MIAVPSIQLYGAGDLRRIAPFGFEGSIGVDITDFGKQFYQLHKGSITLGEQAALFQAYLASELGQAPALPNEVRGVLYTLFDKIGRGNVTDDACDYDHGKRLKKVKPTDRSVRWIVHPQGFEGGEDGWEAKLGPDSDVYHILLPEPGYVERTCDGAYHPKLGVPFSTVPRREEAEKSWTDEGFSPSFAKKAVSYFMSREEGEGTAAVIRWYLRADRGRFGVGPYDGLGIWNLGVGSFPASRSA